MYNHDSPDFPCQYHAFTFFPNAISKPSLFLFLDVFYDFLIWTSIEPCLGAVGCCLLTLGRLIDLKSSAVYSKIKSTFSWQSLPGKSASEASGNLFGKCIAWVELTNERHSQSEPMVRYGATVDAESVGDDLPTAYKHGLASAKEQV